MSILPNHSHLTPQEVAEYLRVRVRTVYRLVEEGDMPAVQWGKVLRVPRDKFLLWYEQHQQNIPPLKKIA